MIYTLTLNPAIDKTITVPDFEIGKLHYIENVQLEACGKGINVSRTLRALEMDSVALGFIGGWNGHFLLEQLDHAGIAHDFIKTGAESRINLKVYDPTKKGDKKITDINEKGRTIEEGNSDLLIQKIKKIVGKEDILVMSGSAPQGIEDSIYADIISELDCDNVVLDTHGPLLKKGVLAKPYLVKPNLFELSMYHGKNLYHRADIIKAGQKMLENGAQNALVSKGNRGALYLTGDEVYYIPPFEVETKSTTGAGDAMVAGFIYAQEKGLPLQDRLKYAAAAAGTTILTEGSHSGKKSDIETLQKNVHIRKLRKDNRWK